MDRIDGSRDALSGPERRSEYPTPEWRRPVIPGHRGDIRAALDGLLEGEEEVDTIEVVAKARRKLARDRERYEQIAAYAVSAMIADELRYLLSGRRAERLLSDEGVRSLMTRVFEPTGGTSRSAFTHMTRPDLLYAAKLREEKAGGLLRVAQLERALAAELPDDLTTVGEHFSNARLATLWRRYMEQPRAA